jgi:hypothetical protein
MGFSLGLARMQRRGAKGLEKVKVRIEKRENGRVCVGLDSHIAEE